MNQKPANWLASLLVSLGLGGASLGGVGAIDAERKKQISEINALHAKHGRPLIGEGAPVLDNLADVNDEALQAVEAGAAAAENMDADALANSMADALDIDAIQAELDALNAEAKKPPPTGSTGLEQLKNFFDFAGLPVDGLLKRVSELTEMVAKGLDTAAVAATTATTAASTAAATGQGTFSARQAVEFGRVDLQKRMAKDIHRISKNTDPKNAKPLAATS